jgi:NAD(P)H-flavin reductase
VRETRQDYGRVQLAIGAKHPSLILFGDEIEEWEADPKLELTVTVDEPDSEWTGCTGVVTEPLKEFRVDPKETVAAVVGPPVMYKFVVRELLEKEIPEDRIFLSLERRFKCGIGKCGHCQLNDMYVCQDGPVFRYTDLVGRTEAIEAWAPERKQDA